MDNDLLTIEQLENRAAQPNNDAQEMENTALANPTTATPTRTKLFVSPQKTFKRRKMGMNNKPVTELATEALSIMKDIKTRPKDEKDEYSLYGEQIAIKIRKLPSERSRAMVQHKINNILFDEEMKYADGGGTSRNHWDGIGTSRNSRDPYYSSSTQYPHFRSYTQADGSYTGISPPPVSETSPLQISTQTHRLSSSSQSPILSSGYTSSTSPVGSPAEFPPMSPIYYSQPPPPTPDPLNFGNVNLDLQQ